MIPAIGPCDRSCSTADSMADGELQSIGDAGRRRSHVPRRQTLEAKTTARRRLLVPSSVIRTLPPAMRPRRSIGSVESIVSRTRRWTGSCGLPFDCADRPDAPGEMAVFGSDLAVCLFGEGGHPVDDHTQGAGSGQGVHRLGGIGEALQHREFIAHLPKDLDSLDGIDPQVGFHIKVEAEGLDRIACPIAHGLEQPGCDRSAVELGIRDRRRGVVVWFSVPRGSEMEFQRGDSLD